MLKAVILDWAGTMVDFGSRAPVAAMQAVFASAGVTASETTVRAFMGMAKREHVTAILGAPEVARAWAEVHGAPSTEVDVDRLMAALEPALAEAAAQHADLIPGAADAVTRAKTRGLAIGSTTGYTRTMMAGVAPRAAAHGYAPAAIICAGDTPRGRPAPFLIWACLEALDLWPAAAAVVVDDAPVGTLAGRHAGAWSVGVAGSGNEVGLGLDAYRAMSPSARATRLDAAAARFAESGADLVIETVADLDLALDAIAAAQASGARPGDRPCLSLWTTAATA